MFTYCRSQTKLYPVTMLAFLLLVEKNIRFPEFVRKTEELLTCSLQTLIERPAAAMQPEGLVENLC